MSNRFFRLIFVLVCMTGISCIFWLQNRIDQIRKGNASEEEYLLFTSGPALKKMALGHEGLLANIYWMRAVQYFGDKRLRGETAIPLLSPLIDIAVTLDPQLIEPYQFGAIFLSEAVPIGAGSPLKAVTLLKKGIEANPDNWLLDKSLGFVYYWYLRDYPSAARAFLSGSGKRGAGPWLKAMAAALLASGGNRNSSQFLWAQIYETAETASMKENARENLIMLKAEEEVEILQSILKQVMLKTGKKIRSFEELVDLGIFKRLPEDPKGFPYQIDATTNQVKLSPQSNVRRY